MRPHLAWWWAPVAVGAAVAAGSYGAAVLDEVVGRLVARRPVRPLEAAAVPLRKGALLLLQQRVPTEHPDREAWALAPALLGALGAVVLVLVPVTPKVAVADVDAGILLFGAAWALVMVAVFLQGWSPNSPLPMIAGYRFVAVALSYEMPIALVLIGTALPAESLAIGEIVSSQQHLWNVLRQPLGLPLYLTAAAGLSFWGPMALPEGTDLAGGTSAEASGGARLAWRLARLTVLVAVSAMGAAAFLGGWWGPILPGPAWVVVKTLGLLAVIVTAGHLLSRVRTERFVVVAWAALIPLALLDVAQAGIQALAAR